MTERAFPSHGGLSRGWTLAHDSRVSGTLGVRLPAPAPLLPRSPFCQELKNTWRDPHWVPA